MAFRIADRAHLHAVIAFAAVCPETPPWPLRAWDSFLAPEEEESVAVHRSMFLGMFPARSEQEALVGLIAVAQTAETTELELLLVHPGVRRQGIGRGLVSHWLTSAACAGVWEAILEVRASNEGAQKLYGELGFTVQGRRKRYYHHPEEDAILMSKDL